MPISDDEWESGREWSDLESAVAEFLDGVAPRAYSVPELHELLAEGGTVASPSDDEPDGLDVVRDGEYDAGDEASPDRVDVVGMDVTERAVREAVTGLRDAEYLDSKEIRTGDGFVTYYRRCDCGMF